MTVIPMSARRTRRSSPAEPAVTPLGSVLVPSDLSATADRAVARVARLPLAAGARVTLLHVLPHGLPATTRKLEEREALEALAHAAQEIARRAPPRVKVRSMVVLGDPATEIARRAIAMRADLVVMGAGGEATLRDLFLGSTAERVIRRGRVPVLAVRLRPTGAYRRPAIAIDAEGGVAESLMTMVRLLEAPLPAIDAIHAFELPYGGLVYRRMTAADRRGYLDRERRRALRALAESLAGILAAADLPRAAIPELRTHVREGSARGAITEVTKELRTDLLVLGTRARTGVAHAFLGSVAGDVLRLVKGDVLVVPCAGRAD